MDAKSNLRVVTICARKGSKGLPGKNKKLLNDLPLYAHAILQAVNCNLFNSIVVSSDDEEIIRSARSFGATQVVIRPDELSGENIGKPETIRHAVLKCEELTNTQFNTVVDLDITSPLRLNEDILGAVEMLEVEKLDCVITGCVSHRNPYFNLVEINKDGYANLSKQNKISYLSRQMAPKCYDMNASVHVWDRNSLIEDPKLFYPKTKLYEMPEDRSRDIDSALDFSIVDLIMNNRER
jgi:N-acylneuraminate cytidylyltransferase/CMP-N,N'-diacetyllegionaminic acid synthase